MTIEHNDYAQHSTAPEAELELLRTQQKYKDRALNLLYRLSLVGRSYTALPDFLTAIYHELHVGFALDTCLLAVCDPEQPLVFSMALTATTAQIHVTEQVRADALTRQVLQLQAPLLIQDLQSEWIADGHTDALAAQISAVEPGMRAWLGVPLFSERAVVGVSFSRVLNQGAILNRIRNCWNRQVISLQLPSKISAWPGISVNSAQR